MLIARYNISYTAAADAVLPGYLGSMLRGLFGTLLMEHDPALFALFFRPQAPDNALIRNFTGNDLPAPFIISPHRFVHFVRAGHRISFTFTLFGRFFEYEDDIRQVFGRIPEIGLFNGKAPVSGFAFRPAGTNTAVVDLNRLPIPEGPVSNLMIRFLTPLAINTKRRLTADFAFERFFGYLYRRLYVLQQLYDPASDPIPELPPFNIKDLHIQPVNIRLQRRQIFRSPSRAEKFPMTGWTGSINYAGNLTPVLPYLEMGRYVHVGNKTVFGLGKYRLEYPKPPSKGRHEKQA